MANKIFKNETAYDPGRYRFKLDFYTQTSTPDGAGGTTQSWILSQSTRAIKEVFPKRVNEQGQIIVQGGTTDQEEVWYFTIRYRRDWQPTKNMNFICENVVYTIRAIMPIDIPVNYMKMVAIQSDLTPDIFVTT